MEKPILTASLSHSEPGCSLWPPTTIPLLKKKIKSLHDLCKTETEVRFTKPGVLGCSFYPPHCSSPCASVQSIGLCLLGHPSGERCGKTCVEERDNQWLGVSLSRQPKESGSIVVCINHWVCVAVCQTAISFPRLPC